MCEAAATQAKLFPAMFQSFFSTGKLSHRRRQRQQKRSIRVFFKTLSRVGPHSSLERERKIRRRLFASSIKSKLSIFTS